MMIEYSLVDVSLRQAFKSLDRHNLNSPNRQFNLPSDHASMTRVESSVFPLGSWNMIKTENQ